MIKKLVMIIILAMSIETVWAGNLCSNWLIKFEILTNGNLFPKKSQELTLSSHYSLVEYFSAGSINHENDWPKLLEMAKSPKYSKLLLMLNDLSFLARKSADLKQFIFDIREVNFNKFTTDEKNQFFEMLKNDKNNEVRALYFKIRSLYMNAIYDSEYGEKLAKVKLPPKIISKNLESKLKFKQERALAEYDVIVVGSGPAGALIASEYTAKGKTVLLLEKGPFFDPTIIDSRRYSELRAYGGIKYTDDSSMIFRSGEASGGGTAVNIDLAFSPLLAPVRQKLDLWRKNNFIKADQWTPTEVEKAYQFVVDKVGTRSALKNEINENNKTLFDGAKKLGFSPRLYGLNVSDNNFKFSANNKFIIPAMQNGMHFSPSTEVRNVIFSEDKKKAIGVRISRMKAPSLPGIIANPQGLELEETIFAKKIVLSSGSLGTAKILLKSGIKNKNIGKHIIAHPSMPVIGKFNHPINILDGMPSTVYLPQPGFILESTSATPGYAAIMMPGNPADVRARIADFNYYAGFGVMIVDESKVENKLYLDQEGELQIHYELTAEDQKKMINGVFSAIHIMFEAGATEVIIPSTEASTSFKSYSEALKFKKHWELTTNKNIFTSAHIQGSARIGDLPENSVVNDKQEVWGIKNLYVADSSIHPTSIGANPMQAIYTLAKIFSDTH